MNFNSINRKISILFAISLTLLIAVFFAYTEYDKKRLHRSINDKYAQIAHNIHRQRMSSSEVESFVKPFGLLKENNHREIHKKALILGADRGFETLSYKENFYLHLLTPSFRMLFKDTTSYSQDYLLYAVFAVLLFLFLFIYYLLIKNVNDTKLLMQSRQLFLRTVMHELKTPIAKGRIVSELIDDEKQKSRMVILFQELNAQLDEMAKIEQVISKNYALNKHIHTLKELLESATNKLMLENTDSISLELISTKKIEVDLELFSTAVKNLIDNALKYSLDNRVVVRENEGVIMFISQGERLSKPLEDYFKPFHNDTDSKTHGMGLGLYIVNAIVTMHNMKLQYEYKNSQNIFKIILEVPYSLLSFTSN